MKKFLLTAAVVLSLPLSLQAQMTPVDQMPAGVYKIEPTHTSVTWKVKHLGLSNYTARFTKIDGTLTFDPKDPTQSKLVASVDPSSVKTDYPNAAVKDFDKELTGDTFFNTTKFPEASFVSTKIEKTGENTGLIHGDLTFMGVTKPMTLKATFNGSYLKKPMGEQPILGFSATATMNRSEWGLKTMVPHIGDSVELHIEAEFIKSN